MDNGNQEARRIRFEEHIFPLELEEIAQRQEKLVEERLEPHGTFPLLARPASIDSVDLPPPPSALEAACAAWKGQGILKSAGAWILRPVGKLFTYFKHHPFGPDRPKLMTRFRGRKPSTDLGLVGLALSGGGIRSATFNLGVVQALAAHGIFRRLDYISTVSGGGYLGSCLSSLLNRQGKTAEFPFGGRSTGRESSALRHLRNNSNYLAPGGLIDLVRIPALLLRGILIHLAVLLPYVVAAVWLTYFFWGPVLLHQKKEWTFFYRLTLTTTVLFFVWALLSPAVQRLWPYLVRWLSWMRFRTAEPEGMEPSSPRRRRIAPAWLSRLLAGSGISVRRWYEGTFGILLLLVVAAALIELLPTLLSFIHAHRGGGRLGVLVEAVRKSWWWTVLGSLIAFMSAGAASATVSKLRGKVVLAALGLLGPLLLLGIYIGLGEWCIYGEPPAFAKLLDLIPFSGHVEALREQLPASPRGPGEGWMVFTLLALLLGAYTTRYVDANATSLHSFYRDRLSKAYLFQVDDEECIEGNDTQRLSELNRSRSSPYHLINAALNLQASEDPNLRGRMSDFFFFSKHFVGSERTGYCPTQQMETVHPRLDLGTAMAISGAAAAPNMGTSTNKALVFVMTLLNVRLGYWIPNPGCIEEQRLGALLKLGVGPWYLLFELFGRLSEKSMYVNVSDGGHIENLGIYELLRRRCKLIIASDAEADPKLTFGGLATLMRYAWIDLGIQIDLDLNEIRRREDGLSRRHCALGKIHYPKTGEGQAETGYLLYLKSSIGGEEAETIREYRARNADFPHETTADQFFDEAQFEAYRSLGQHVAHTLFRRKEDYDVAEWFEELGETLRPDFRKTDAFIDLQNQLSALERDLSAPGLAVYAYQIYPEVDPRRYTPSSRFAETIDPRAEIEIRAPFAEPADEGGGEETAGFRKAFHFINRQLQLMENAYLALELDRPANRDHQTNSGWMNLFRRWAQAPYFRRAWAVSISTYSYGFQRFCQEALHLRSEISCSPREWLHLTRREQEYLEEWHLDGFVREAAAPGDERQQYLLWGIDLCVDLGSTRSMEERTEQRERRTWPGEPDPLEEFFPVGFALLRVTWDAKGSRARIVDLMFCRIRDFYRQMRLFDRALEALDQRIQRDFSAADRRVVFPAGREDDLEPFAWLFERKGFEVVRQSGLRRRRRSRETQRIAS